MVKPKLRSPQQYGHLLIVQSSGISHTFNVMAGGGGGGQLKRNRCSDVCAQK